MMGGFAEFERAMIQERVRAGLARARTEGKRLGRPPIAPEVEERIRKALATPGRPGVRKIAERFGVDPGTVQRISRPFEASAAGACPPPLGPFAQLRPRPPFASACSECNAASTGPCWQRPLGGTHTCARVEEVCACQGGKFRSQAV